MDARARARPQRRPHRDRRLPRQERAFDRAILEFSHAYAEQNERDYKALAAGVIRAYHGRDGALTVTRARAVLGTTNAHTRAEDTTWP